MHEPKPSHILLETTTLTSTHLQRDITVDFYLPNPVDDPASINLLLINDGQNLEEMGLQSILENLYEEDLIRPILCVGIHANEDRKMEYGIASQKDYLGRGARAAKHTAFVLEELMPYISHTYALHEVAEKAIAGFSLGGLAALDTVWHHPEQFSKAGVFSGSLWWRSVDQEEPDYDDDKHRIMHQIIRKGSYRRGLKFFLQSGNMDETNDRNQNGIIDSIDDTLDLIKELADKGYEEKDIFYLEMADGKHDIPTWARAMPIFLKWGWGR